MNRTLLRLLVAPRTLYRYAVDRVIAPLHFALNGVSVGKGVFVSGLPILRLAQGSRLSIGNGVKLLSRPSDNPLRNFAPCSFSLIQPNAIIEIGEQSSFSGTVMCAATRITIGKHVMIGANCTISDTDFHPILPEQRRVHRTRGAATRPVVIEDDVFIGTQAVILKGTHLGAGCVVGAGAVVSGTFPPRSVIVGSPAVVVKQLEPPESA